MGKPYSEQTVNITDNEVWRWRGKGRGLLTGQGAGVCKLLSMSPAVKVIDDEAPGNSVMGASRARRATGI